MKNWMILLVALALAQAHLRPVLPRRKAASWMSRGRQSKMPRSYCSTTGEQVAGMATDPEGRFSLKVPTGDYTLQIQYLGYEPLTQSVRVEAENDLGDFTLHAATTQIEGSW